MARFWAVEPDPAFLHLCAKLGPLASFESLLSMHGEDVAIFNDMLVAVEDLRSVEFTLILVDRRSAKRVRARNRSTNSSGSGGGGSGGKKGDAAATVQLLQYHSFPLPRVTGSRSSLKVMLPVPDYVYTMLPLEQVRGSDSKRDWLLKMNVFPQIKTMTFTVTPVLFNIGINEKASMAARMPGANAPQEKNNLDNFKTLHEYHRRFKRLQLPTMQQSGMTGRAKRERCVPY